MAKCSVWLLWLFKAFWVCIAQNVISPRDIFHRRPTSGEKWGAKNCVAWNRGGIVECKKK